MTDIDITELLEEYVRLLEKSGISRDSTESKLMLEASVEIKKLRESLDFQIKLADDSNKSRVRLLDVVNNAMELYEETCKRIRDVTVETYVCGMCRWDCDHGLDGYANECPRFETDDCFELDYDKYRNIIFKAGEQK